MTETKKVTKLFTAFLLVCAAGYGSLLLAASSDLWGNKYSVKDIMLDISSTPRYVEVINQNPDKDLTLIATNVTLKDSFNNLSKVENIELGEVERDDYIAISSSTIYDKLKAKNIKFNENTHLSFDIVLADPNAILRSYIRDAKNGGKIIQPVTRTHLYGQPQ